MTKQEEIRGLLKSFALGIAGYQEQYQVEEAEEGVDGLMRDIKALGGVIRSDRKLETLSIHGSIGLRGEWVKKVDGLVAVEELI
ncbi:hypothetical protein LCGC14_1427620 [marine sediment metagenome]|uniref:Uncharacterized protein n=1 Tax=marine sediment metagenome TaxID=412755 RepID=A0A0F9M4Z9_9ZZZZ